MMRVAPGQERHERGEGARHRHVRFAKTHAARRQRRQRGKAQRRLGREDAIGAQAVDRQHQHVGLPPRRSTRVTARGHADADDQDRRAARRHPAQRPRRRRRPRPPRRQAPTRLIRQRQRHQRQHQERQAHVEAPLAQVLGQPHHRAAPPAAAIVERLGVELRIVHDAAREEVAVADQRRRHATRRPHPCPRAHPTHAIPPRAHQRAASDPN